MNCEQHQHRLRSLRGLTGSFLLGASKYAHIPLYIAKYLETRALPVIERLALILPYRSSAGCTGSLGSFLYNVREMSKYVINGKRVGTITQDPVHPATPILRIPEFGSSLGAENAGNSHPDFPGVGGVKNHFTIHTARLP